MVNFTEQDFNRLLIEQNGLCAICSKPLTNWYEPALDHNHKTGQARGLLCLKCNRGIGCFDDDPNLLEAASKYMGR